MTNPFDYFVVFAEMRTGSNFLETNLNAFSGIECHGEAFNPHFIGYPNRKDILGVTQAMRDASPDQLLTAIREHSGGLGGFRYFHDHDPRVLDLCLDDPRCAKIILTRNPLESYVSWKIAQATGQWKLTDMKRRKDGKARFDAAEFAEHLGQLQAFQVRLLNRLQTSGQTAFYVAYEDLQSVEVINGLARFLGVDEQLEGLDKSLKRQNPSPLSAKVSNFTEMEQSLGGLDLFDLGRTPNFEPRRAAAVPTYVAAAGAPLLYLPLKGGPEREVITWLAALDGVTPDELRGQMSQKDLRQWKRRHVGHRSFTVVRHPLARAHATFCSRILGTGPESYGQIRQTLRKTYGVPIPDDGATGYDRAAHRDAFAGFLQFVQQNLAGQTGVRVDATWCSQSQLMQGFAEMALPDMVIREAEMPAMLPALANMIGIDDAVSPDVAAADEPFGLHDIYDESLEALGRQTYQRDYMMFGFGPWG